MQGGYCDEGSAEQRCLLLLCEVIESLCPAGEPEETGPYDSAYGGSGEALLDPATETMIEVFLRELVRSTEDLLRVPEPIVWN